MKNSKDYIKTLNELYNVINCYHNEYCEETSTNIPLRCKNTSIMKQIKKELEDLGE